MMVGSVLHSSSLTDGTVLTMVSNLTARITVLSNGTTYINSARILGVDWPVLNGVAHFLEK